MEKIDFKAWDTKKEMFTNFIAIHYKGHQISYIYTDTKFYVGMTYEFSASLSEELQEKLYNLIDKYARTPLEEREEQERFFLKFKIETDNDCNFLNYDKNDDEPTLDNRLETSNFQTRFTQKEINDIRRKFGLTLSDFEQIPVDEYCEEF